MVHLITQRKITFVQMIYRMCIFIACAFAFCNASDYPEKDSDEDDPIFAYFCFYEDTIPWIKEDNVYTLSYYEMRNEFTIIIDYESTMHFSMFGTKLPDLNQEKIRTDFFRGTKGGKCYSYSNICEKNKDLCKYPKAKCNRNRVIKPYDLIDFYFLQKDSLYVKSLFKTTKRLTWEYHLEMGKQRQKISGDNTIYISGFCTEEQLKAIRERKKQELKENKANEKSTP